MQLIFIYGPPGVGKLTVANELGRLTGFKVFHNHLSFNCVHPVFDFGTEPFAKLVKQIRLAVIEEAALENVDIVFTFVYANPVDNLYVEEICGTVERLNGGVSFVRLACDKEILYERISSPERESMGKLHSADGMRYLMERYDIFSPVPARESLTIDNTDLGPEETAKKIIQHYGLP